MKQIKHFILPSFNYLTRIGGAMARLLTLSVVDRRLVYRSGHTKDYQIGYIIREKEQRLNGWESG